MRSKRLSNERKRRIVSRRYTVCFEKGQGKFGTEAKEKAERAKRQMAKLRREFRFQAMSERSLLFYSVSGLDRTSRTSWHQLCAAREGLDA